MEALLAKARGAALDGQGIDAALARSLAGAAMTAQGLERLCALADEVRKRLCGNAFALCSIVNARSGQCAEDCTFCAQSIRHRARVDSYAFIDFERAVNMVRESAAHRVPRLSLVTSGRAPNAPLLARLGRLYARLAEQYSFEFCASLGLIDVHQARQLRHMGVTRYHCNLESGASFFSRVCTTHGHADKVASLLHARAAGLSLCSGGIIGMGEEMEDRIALACELRDLGVRSIPINILTPIPGTPLGEVRPMALDEALRSIALFRLVNPDAVIRMAGGRGRFGQDQYRFFQAGANGAIVGNYLTTLGNPIDEDIRRFKDLGFHFDGA